TGRITALYLSQLSQCCSAIGKHIRVQRMVVNVLLQHSDRDQQRTSPWSWSSSGTICVLIILSRTSLVCSAYFLCIDSSINEKSAQALRLCNRLRNVVPISDVVFLN